MASKREISTIVNESEQSDYESDDNDNIPLIKRSKMTMTLDSDSNDPLSLTSSPISKYIRITEDEIYDERDSFNFNEKSGPQCTLSPDAKPIEYFNLFFNSSLWTLMVKETNRYAEQLLQSPQLSIRSRMKRWKPVSTLEMKAFVAVLLEMEITKRPTLFSYWAENSRSIPWFQQMFSRNRFQLILRCFQIVNNEECLPPSHENYDPYAKFNPIIEHANEVFKLHYVPHQQLSVKESFMGSEWSSSTVQYLPKKKQHRWGVKVWMLCDTVSNYCTSFYCYRGVKSKIDNDEIKKMGLGYNVVTKLLKQSNYLNKGYHVFVNSFFTGTALAKYLYSQNTYLTGTIGRNNKEIPNEIKTVKVDEVKYFRNGEILLCGYREKKTTRNPILLISTQSARKNTTAAKKRQEKDAQKIKPFIISAYNNFMGGVDECNKMVHTYLDERRTLKCWKRVTFNIFARMVLNSYIVYKEVVRTKVMSQLQFTSHIISEIECEWMQERKQQLKDEKKTFGLLKLPGRNLRQCVVCTNGSNGIKRSNLICAQCKKGLHALCFDKHECKNH